MYQDDLDKNSSEGPFGSVTSFGETLYSINSNGWINSVSFSPSCKQMCFSTHDCELNIVDVSDLATGGKKDKSKPYKLLLRGNPLLKTHFISEDKIIGGGFDKVPILYKQEGSEWKMSKILDSGVGNTRKAKISGNAFMDKKVYFNSDFKLGNSIEMKETDSKHANYINFMQENSKGELVTSDVNGYLCWWDLK